MGFFEFMIILALIGLAGMALLVIIYGLVALIRERRKK
jgi:hypothetical protein